MDILTSVIAGRVYGLNLKDLPLDRLSEQKHKKRRHQLGSKLNEMDKAKVAPSPSMPESKPEVTSSFAAPVTLVATTVEKTAEAVKNEANIAVVSETREKAISGKRILKICKHCSGNMEALFVCLFDGFYSEC